LISAKYGSQILVGAGTVLKASEVESTVDAGGRLIVAPNILKEVAQAAVAAQCIYLPGVATPTEAFEALALGADGLKLFPAEMITPSVVKSMRAVLPAATRVFPVGGISADNMTNYMQVGATGLGIGSSLFRPGKSIFELSLEAERLVVQVKKSRV